MVTVRVNADKQVSFSSYDPDATKVSQQPYMGIDTDLTKVSSGVWSVKISVLKSGIYRYFFNIDGITVPDSKNETINNL